MGPGGRLWAGVNVACSSALRVSLNRALPAPQDCVKRQTPFLPDCPSLSRVYGGSDELSDDITQQQLLPGVKYQARELTLTLCVRVCVCECA